MILNERNAPFISFSGARCVDVSDDRTILPATKT